MGVDSMASGLYAAIIGAIIIVFITKVVGLFPSYMMMVTEAYNLAGVAAADNYVQTDIWQKAKDTLDDNGFITGVKIEVRHSDGTDAVGDGDEYAFINLSDKPYQQRGGQLTVTIEAIYPFDFEVWGVTIGANLPVSYSVTTTGTKYYKDLDI